MTGVAFRLKYFLTVRSVKSKGVLEPVLVRESDKRLVLDFRRYDAARQGGLAEIPVVLGE